MPRHGGRPRWRGGGRGGRGGRGHYAQAAHSGAEHGYGGGGEAATSDGGLGDRPPPGLRGRAIGMWHAARSRKPAVRAKRQERMRRVEERNRPVLRVDQRSAHVLKLACDQLIMDYRSAVGGATSSTDGIKLEPVDAIDDTDPMEFDTMETGGEDFVGEQKLLEAEWQADDSQAPLGIRQSVDMNHVERLIRAERDRVGRARGTAMQRFRESLPAYAHRNELLRKIDANRVVIVSGETGCGKSTQVPQIILEDAFEKGVVPLPYVVCTQPRRICAVSLASRVADERHEPLGIGVGYQIRFDNRRPANTAAAILYCTTGVVMEWLKTQPDLAGVSHVILDEAHERDLCTDFMLIWMKRLLIRRPDVKLIVMSATLNAQLFADYFALSPEEAMLSIPGRTFTVQRYYLEDLLCSLPPLPHDAHRQHERTFPKKYQRAGKERAASVEEARDAKYSASDYVYEGQVSSPVQRRAVQRARSIHDEQVKYGKLDTELIGQLFTWICRNHTERPDEAILIFVPGWNDIKSLMDVLSQISNENRFNCSFVPLHSLLPNYDQNKVFRRPDGSERKVVISTILAESSVTIDDVVHVIDTCRTKMSSYNHALNVQTLRPEWTASANCDQRAGRAGRTRPGFCYHLIPKYRYDRLMPHFQLPEMQRVRLHGSVLRLKLMRVDDVVSFLAQAPTPPGDHIVRDALAELNKLGALNDSERLTPLGTTLAHMPVEPRCGKILVYGALFSCLDPALSVAACLDYKDPFHTPMGMEAAVDQAKRHVAGDTNSDSLLWWRVLAAWEYLGGGVPDYVNAPVPAPGYGEYKRFVHFGTCKQLVHMKRQFGEVLKRRHLLPTHASYTLAELNRNSDSDLLINAIVCAGLYPYVARGRAFNARRWADGRSQRPLTFSTKTVDKVDIHPKSVCKGATHMDTRYVCYNQLVRSSNGASLYDVTPASPLSLVLFSGDLDMRHDAGSRCLVLDNWIELDCDVATAQLLNDCRLCIATVIQERCTWRAGRRPMADCGRVSQRFVDALVELLKAERVELKGRCDEGGASDDDDDERPQ